MYENTESVRPKSDMIRFQEAQDKYLLKVEEDSHIEIGRLKRMIDAIKLQINLGTLSKMGAFIKISRLLELLDFYSVKEISKVETDIQTLLDTFENKFNTRFSKATFKGNLTPKKALMAENLILDSALDPKYLDVQFRPSFARLQNRFAKKPNVLGTKLNPIKAEELTYRCAQKALSEEEKSQLISRSGIVEKKDTNSEKSSTPTINEVQ